MILYNGNQSINPMKTQPIQLKKPSEEDILTFRRSSQKIAELLKSQGISEDEIIDEFNTMRREARRNETK